MNWKTMAVDACNRYPHEEEEYKCIRMGMGMNRLM